MCVGKLDHFGPFLLLFSKKKVKFAYETVKFTPTFFSEKREKKFSYSEKYFKAGLKSIIEQKRTLKKSVHSRKFLGNFSFLRKKS